MNDKTAIIPQKLNDKIARFLQSLAVPMTTMAVAGLTGWMVWVSVAATDHLSDKEELEVLNNRVQAVEAQAQSLEYEIRVTRTSMRQGFESMESAIAQNNALLVRAIFRQEINESANAR